MTGIAMSWISHDPVPLIASAFISAVFIGGYEYMIRHPATEDGISQIPCDLDPTEPVQGSFAGYAEALSPERAENEYEVA